jgi:hypothetical protein
MTSRASFKRVTTHQTVKCTKCGIQFRTSYAVNKLCIVCSKKKEKRKE